MRWMDGLDWIGLDGIDRHVNGGMDSMGWMDARTGIKGWMEGLDGMVWDAMELCGVRDECIHAWMPLAQGCICRFMWLS